MKNILLLLTIFFAVEAYALQPGVKHYQNPSKASDFKLYDTNSMVHKMGDYRGRVVIINFWATWCVPCRKEIPSLKNAWDIFEKEGVQLLGIATKDSIEDVVQFQRENDIQFPIPLDEDGSVADNWGVAVVPTAFVLDTSGNIIMRIVGGDEWNKPELIESIIALKYKAAENGFTRSFGLYSPNNANTLSHQP
jgi:peroxiredoxin